MALGRYDPSGRNGKTLADIRAALNEKRSVQRNTGDAKEHERAAERRKALEARRGTFGQMLDAYVEDMQASEKVSATEVKGLFRRHVTLPFPALSKTKASEILPGDITQILARMVKKGITRQVNVLRSYLRAAFAYGAKADHNPRQIARDGVLFGLNINPVAVVPRIEEYERVGERVLTEGELREYWNALDALPVVQRAFLRLNLALAGQRPTQLLRADWAAFDFQEGTLLVRDKKGRGGSRDHLLPLPEFAIAELQVLRERNATAPTPFTARGKRTMVIDTLSHAVGKISATLNQKKQIPTFDQKDLRRTCETMLQKLGIDREVRAHLLSHGRSQGVQGKHYERYDFFTEKRAALQKWAAHLGRIIDPTKSATVAR